MIKYWMKISAVARTRTSTQITHKYQYNIMKWQAYTVEFHQHVVLAYAENIFLVISRLFDLLNPNPNDASPYMMSVLRFEKKNVFFFFFFFFFVKKHVFSMFRSF